MLSGPAALRSIDGTLGEVRHQGHELDQMVQQTSTALLNLRQQKIDRYRRLAALRLEELLQDEAQRELDQTDRQVRALIDQRDEQLRDLQRTIDELEQQQQALEAQREKLESDVQGALEALDRAEAKTQQRLRDSAAHQSALSRAQAADATAGEAETKAEQAESDRVEKGKPYESEPLFMYLWTRGFGTSRYSAPALIRYLDTRIAKLCGFQQARPNYAMLLEIPLRLREHAQQLRGSADALFEQLRALEEDAAREDGVHERRQDADRAQQALDELDARIHDLERQTEALMERRTAYVGGEDECSNKALGLLAAQFQQRTMEELRGAAQATANAEDDLILHELRDLEYEESRLEESLTHHKAMHARHLQRQRELEQVRRNFKDRRYDDPQATFANEDLVNSMLREFLRGVAGSADVWGTLRRNKRQRPRRADPDFGSGGFGRGGGTWRLPSGGGGGSSGSGGFRTGGEF